VSLSLLAPLPSDTQRGVLLALNGAEVALGVLAWLAPWTRWHRLCFWLFAPCALGMISVANVAGGFDPYSFAVYFTVVFVWIGVSRPRWTSLLVLPLAALAYLAPLQLLDRPTSEWFTLLWVAPVWLLVAESLGWLLARLRRTELTLARANQNVGALLTAATYLGAGAGDQAQAAGVLARVSRELLGCASATVLLPDPEVADLLHRRGDAGDGLAVAAPGVWVSSSLRARLDPPRIWNLTDHQEPSVRALLAVAGVAAGLVIVLEEPDRPQRRGGVIIAGWPVSPTARTDPELLTQACALLRAQGGRLLAQARRVEQIAHDAQTDPLTGLPNRRRLHEVMATLQPGSAIAVIDLDHFKVINDRFGHPAGDQVLRDLAGCLQQISSSADTPARLGGEEFVLVCPHGGAAAASTAIARLRTHWHHQSRLTTFSAGIAQMSATESPAQLLHRADAALYSAKSAGRNQTLLATPILPQPRPTPTTRTDPLTDPTTDPPTDSTVPTTATR
jgi:diguanylate cyclase (GGDEF)-like protein